MCSTPPASASHSIKVGARLNPARAKMLLGHVHAALGAGPTAKACSQESHDDLAVHAPADGEIAFAHAVLAHAAHAAGETALHQQLDAKAAQLGQATADPEDREIFLRTLQCTPGPHGPVA